MNGYPAGMEGDPFMVSGAPEPPPQPPTSTLTPAQLAAIGPMRFEEPSLVERMQASERGKLAASVPYTIKEGKKVSVAPSPPVQKVGMPGMLIGAIGGLAAGGLVEGVIGGVTGALSNGGTQAMNGTVTAPVGVGLGAGAGEVAPGTDVAVYGGYGVYEGVPFGGPGVPEPSPGLAKKAWVSKCSMKQNGGWKTFWLYYWQLVDGRCMCYNPVTKAITLWRPKKHIVISRNPRMSQIRRLERTYDRVIRGIARKSKALKLQK